MTVKVTQFGPRRSLVTVADYRIAAEAGATTLEIETVGTDEKQASERTSGCADATRSLFVLSSSLGGPHRHARIHDEALVSGIRRRRPLTGHLLLTVTPPAPRL
jgi:hypothetical protein